MGADMPSARAYVLGIVPVLHRTRQNCISDRPQAWWRGHRVDRDGSRGERKRETDHHTYSARGRKGIKFRLGNCGARRTFGMDRRV